MIERPEVSDRVFEVVRRVVAESLALEPTRVQLGSGLINDLGADSLDFVDIIFMLEQQLEIKMRDSELDFLTRLDFSSPDVMKNGHLTPEVVDQLAAWLPAVAAQPDRTKISPQTLFSLITIEAICIVATRQLGKAT